MCRCIDNFNYFKLEQHLLEKLHGSNPQKFLDWFFATSKLSKGGVIDCSELNSGAHVIHIPNFQSFCLNRFFLASRTNFLRRIAPSMIFKNPQFETFMRHSAGIVGSLQPIIFRKKDLKKYHLFGFLMKIIEKLAQPSVVLLGRQRLPHYFGRFHSRINGKLLNL